MISELSFVFGQLWPLNTLVATPQLRPVCHVNNLRLPALATVPLVWPMGQTKFGIRTAIGPIEMINCRTDDLMKC